MCQIKGQTAILWGQFAAVLLYTCLLRGYIEGTEWFDKYENYVKHMPSQSPDPKLAEFLWQILASS